ncbi:substrate-binding domain-containing protein [Granulosicoccus sp.]|nr:substrate-binding domain-containing protein [Granulosicoccus sp.]MDB4223711.1 substrate-binding domain-containing protein [Granulosicoccus sp.]
MIKHSIDCVICVSDSLAFGVITALREDGVQVPSDVGVAGSGNFEVSRYSSPSISTVKVDPAKIGRIAAELVVKLLDSDDNIRKVPKKYSIEVAFSMRDSTCARGV